MSRCPDAVWMLFWRRMLSWARIVPVTLVVFSFAARYSTLGIPRRAAVQDKYILIYARRTKDGHIRSAYTTRCSQDHLTTWNISSLCLIRPLVTISPPTKYKVLVKLSSSSGQAPLPPHHCTTPKRSSGDVKFHRVCGTGHCSRYTNPLRFLEELAFATDPQLPDAQAFLWDLRE
jgi:hypothetical protein